MREILFRGKCKETGNWYVGNLIHRTEFYGDPVDDYHILHIGEFDCDYYDSTEVIPNTIGQLTGLYDKNGKKIFEGDIVKTKYGRLCIVVWFASPVHNGWDLESIRTFENCMIEYPSPFDLYCKDNLEVVGNIHDNPELLR